MNAVTNPLTTEVIAALEELKAIDITVLDVAKISSVTDVMIIASGSSNRQVKALANIVHVRAKAAGFESYGLQGETAGDWIVVDLGDVVVHLMSPRLRAFYNLESLWGAPAVSTPNQVVKP